jgi:pimeloyl-ACP methyl ester carboxylesterase
MDISLVDLAIGIISGAVGGYLTGTAMRDLSLGTVGDAITGGIGGLVGGYPLLFGASTGDAAALMAAARLGDRAAAIVSRGGRPDLAGDALDRVRTPTLLIVGGDDLLVIDLNRLALERLKGPKALEIVSGAGHRFAERGALEVVVDHARNSLNRYLRHAQEPTSQSEHRRE